MSRLSRFALCALFVLAVPTIAAARRRAPPPPPPPQTQAAGDAAEQEYAPGGGAAGMARLRVAPDPGLDVSTFRAQLRGTSGQLEQCMITAGLTGTLRVTARLALSHALDFDITAPRHDASTTQCAELVLRRALSGVAARQLTTALRSTLTVRHRAVHAPPPAHRPTGDLSAFEAPVHEAIERDRSAMLSCLSAAAPGVTGNASLRLTLAPDGTLALTSANLPTGVSAAPALPCLASRISHMHFSPAPPRAIAIEHTLPLGL